MKGAIQRIFQDHGESYIRENARRLTEQHVEIVEAIQRCGTPAAGWIRFGCTDCSTQHYVERSCGSRASGETG